MESKSYTPSQKNKNQFGLLPNYFKRVGMVVMILVLIPALMLKVMDIQLGQPQKELFKLISLNVLILGLLFIAWAKDKVEDEMTVALRLKSMAFTFIWAVGFVVLKPITDFLFREPEGEPSAQGLILSMLFFYLIIYYLQKKGMRKKNSV